MEKLTWVSLVAAFKGRDESASEPMELDSLPVCDSGSPAAGVLKRKLESPEVQLGPWFVCESVMSAASSVPKVPEKAVWDVAPNLRHSIRLHVAGYEKVSLV